MFYWDPRAEIFTIPYLNVPILWYSVLFALGFALGFPLFVSILSRFFSLCTGEPPAHFRKKSLRLTDRLLVYMVVATVVGARLGHFLFYENPSDYLSNPWEILRTWEGGLSSHGAVLAILIALWIFSRRVRLQAPELTWVRLLDFVAIPTSLCAFFIRIGNFINQEILGTPTDLPWGVVFGHPMGSDLFVARHPVQLYEAIFYLAVFFLLFRLSYLPRFLLSQGKLIGLFLMLVFGFRIFAEYFKLEQSHLMEVSYLTMGQILSVPVFLLGVAFYMFSRGRPVSRS